MRHGITLTFADYAPSALTAASDYRIWLAPVNVESDDGRVIVDTLGARRGRRPIYFSDNEAMHGDAILVGTFEGARRVESEGNVWMVTDDVRWRDTAEAAQARALVDSGEFRAVSIHLGKARFAEVCADDLGGYTEIGTDDIELIFDEEGGISTEAPCSDPLVGAFDAEIASVTILGVEAFPGARIEPETEVVQAATTMAVDLTNLATTIAEDADYPIGEALDALRAAMVESATPVDLRTPPASWFADPTFGPDGSDARLVYDEKNDQWGAPLVVTPSGQVFGHVALWRTCHTGYQGQCVTPPRNAEYSHFLTSRVVTDDGSQIPTGPLVVDEGHAPASWSADRTERHYADTSLAAAYVNVGTDEHGVWVAGAVAPDATEAMVEKLRRHSLSGDWRSIDGVYQFIAAVAVNAPGFPIPQVLVASGHPVGIITFGPSSPEVDTSTEGIVAAGFALLADRIDRLARLWSAPEAELTETEAPCVECGEADETEAPEALVASFLAEEETQAFLAEELALDEPGEYDQT